MVGLAVEDRHMAVQEASNQCTHRRLEVYFATLDNGNHRSSVLDVPVESIGLATVGVERIVGEVDGVRIRPEHGCDHICLRPASLETHRTGTDEPCCLRMAHWSMVSQENHGQNERAFEVLSEDSQEMVGTQDTAWMCFDVMAQMEVLPVVQNSGIFGLLKTLGDQSFVE